MIDMVGASESRLSLARPGEWFGSAAEKFWRGLDLLIDLVLVTALLGELVAVLANIFSRTFLGFSIYWVDETSQIALMTMAFVGGAIAYVRGQHVAIKGIVQRLGESAQVHIAALSDWIVFGVVAVTAWWSIPLLESEWQAKSLELHIPVSFITLPLTVGFSLLMLYVLRLQWRRPWRAVVSMGVAVGAVGIVITQTDYLWRPLVVGEVLWVALAASAILILIGVPIGFVLLFAAIGYLYGSNSIALVVISTSLQSAESSFILLALPFFVLAGQIMDKAGVSARIIDWATALVGHFRGGMHQVVIISMYVFSGISGSKTADMVAVGSAMAGPLRRKGYDPAESVAVLAASATMGETIPPSIAIIVMGSISSVSISALFIGGLLPAAAIAVCLGMLVYFRARQVGLTPGKRAPIAYIGRTSLRAILPMTMPAILLGGIISGIATPTEVSAVAVAYGLFLAFVVYRGTSLLDFWRTLTYTTTLIGMVLFIVGAASAFSLAVSVEMLPTRIANAMAAAGGGKLAFLLLTIVVLVLMGAVLEGIASILIFTPILMPVAITLGINPLQYAIVLIIAHGVGVFSPPIGIGFYVASAVCGVRFEDAMRRMMPYVVVLLIGLALVTFVPWLSLVLPRLFNLAGFG